VSKPVVWKLLAVGALLLVLNAMGRGAFALFFSIQAGIYALLALGLNVQWGYTGLFNVGISSLFALGAYTSALLTKNPVPSPGAWPGLGLPFVVGLVCAALVAALAAALLGSATLRLRGDYLAMVTLGAGEIVRLLLLNESSLTHGAEGLRAIPQPLHTWFPARDYNAFYFVVVLALLALTFWGMERVLRSPWGRALRAVRDDEEAAASLGKNTFVLKFQAFVLGAALMGLAGALYAHFTTFISPADFVPLQTFLVWMMLIAGGSGSNRGAVVGAVLIWGLWVGTSVLGGFFPSQWAVKFSYLRIIAVGLTLQWMLLCRPKGILGTITSPSSAKI